MKWSHDVWMKITFQPPASSRLIIEWNQSYQLGHEIFAFLFNLFFNIKFKFKYIGFFAKEVSDIFLSELLVNGYDVAQ